MHSYYYEDSIYVINNNLCMFVCSVQRWEVSSVPDQFYNRYPHNAQGEDKPHSSLKANSLRSVVALGLLLFPAFLNVLPASVFHWPLNYRGAHFTVL